MRLFIALPLQPTVKIELGSIIADLKRRGGSVKWVEPDNIHLTLRFLGETDRSNVGAVKAAIDEVAQGQQAVQTSLQMLGGFPNLIRPRVIWVGLAESLDPLRKMARDIEHRMRALRFEKEKKSFKAHLTLGRIRTPGDLDDLTEYIKSYQIAQVPVLFDRIVLFKSTLTPKGSIYESLHEASLAL